MWWPQCRGTPDTERYMRSICIYEQSESLKKRKQLIFIWYFMIFIWAGWITQKRKQLIIDAQWKTRICCKHIVCCYFFWSVEWMSLSGFCKMFKKKIYIFLLKFFLFLFSHALDCSRASHQWELGKLDGEEGERPNHTAPALSFITLAPFLTSS